MQLVPETSACNNNGADRESRIVPRLNEKTKYTSLKRFSFTLQSARVSHYNTVPASTHCLKKERKNETRTLFIPEKGQVQSGKNTFSSRACLQLLARAKTFFYYCLKNKIRSL